MRTSRFSSRLIRLHCACLSVFHVNTTVWFVGMLAVTLLVLQGGFHYSSYGTGLIHIWFGFIVLGFQIFLLHAIRKRIAKIPVPSEESEMHELQRCVKSPTPEPLWPFHHPIKGVTPRASQVKTAFLGPKLSRWSLDKISQLCFGDKLLFR